MRPIVLHACCGPCATHCVYALRENGYEPVIYFSNSNIDTAAEFEKRLDALSRFAAAEKVELFTDPYNHDAWREATRGFENEPEGGKRCQRCFVHNLCRTARFAAENGFTRFTTSLTVSPHKNTPLIFAAGAYAAARALSLSPREIAECADFPQPEALCGKAFYTPPGENTPLVFERFNFKKQQGFLHSIELSQKYGLYRQNYCGCAASACNAI